MDDSACSDVQVFFDAVNALLSHDVPLSEGIKMTAEIFEDPLQLLQNAYDECLPDASLQQFAGGIEQAYGQLKAELQEENEQEILAIRGRLRQAPSAEARADYLRKQIQQRQIDRQEIENQLEQLNSALLLQADLTNMEEVSQRVEQMKAALQELDQVVQEAQGIAHNKDASWGDAKK